MSTERVRDPHPLGQLAGSDWVSPCWRHGDKKELVCCTLLKHAQESHTMSCFQSRGLLLVKMS